MDDRQELTCNVFNVHVCDYIPLCIFGCVYKKCD